VAGVASATQAQESAAELPQLGELALRLAVVGAPAAGKTAVAQALARTHNLRLLAPSALAAEALAAADEHLAATAAAAAAAPAAADPAGTGEAAGAAAQLAPSRQAQLGLALRRLLAEGGAPSDELLVQLLVLGMEGSKGWVAPPEAAAAGAGAAKAKAAAPGGKAPPAAAAAPCRGFVVDGFPATRHQAVLLERALTGLDLEVEQVRGGGRREGGGGGGAGAGCMWPACPPARPPTGLPAGRPARPLGHLGTPQLIPAVGQRQRAGGGAAAFHTPGSHDRTLVDFPVGATLCGHPQAFIDASSELAPAPADCLPLVGRSLTSGLDAVLLLEAPSEQLTLDRLLGRRMDPVTGEATEEAQGRRGGLGQRGEQE
jgi:adenylate kinase family enzyme